MLEERGEVEVASAVVVEGGVEACPSRKVVDALNGEMRGVADDVEWSLDGLVSVDDGGAEDAEEKPLCE